TYTFEGYWKDVGTIDSLWEANMDLIDPNRPFDIWDPNLKVYARTEAYPPHYLSATSKVENSLISEGCRVSGNVDFSVLFEGSVVEEGAIIRDSILMPGSIVKKGCIVQYSIVAQGSTLEEGVKLGERPEDMEDLSKWGVAVVGPNLNIGKGATIKAKSMVYEDVMEGEVVC
ncbi:MAG: glucose-1-phosphate adenylyltransferase, partial [Oscillospiraceae bacterium]|nr:glucose-1-phosphate adenylyltransferase [Oscillospiraceae bacterium]